MLRCLLLFIIKLYWVIGSKAWPRECIFRVTCSNFVYKVTAQDGFVAGLNAFKMRWRACRPGYRMVWCDGKMRILLADGSFAEFDEISEDIIFSFNSEIRQAELAIKTREQW